MALLERTYFHIISYVISTNDETGTLVYLLHFFLALSIISVPFLIVSPLSGMPSSVSNAWQSSTTS